MALWRMPPGTERREGIMGRFIFDVFSNKQPIVMLPFNLVFRKRGDKKTPSEPYETYITTIEGNSYQDAISQLLEMIRRDGR